MNYSGFSGASAAPHAAGASAAPHAAGASAAPHAAGFSSAGLSAAPQAVPHAAGAMNVFVHPLRLLNAIDLLLSQKRCSLSKM